MELESLTLGRAEIWPPSVPHRPLPLAGVAARLEETPPLPYSPDPDPCQSKPQSSEQKNHVSICATLMLIKVSQNQSPMEIAFCWVN